MSEKEKRTNRKKAVRKFSGTDADFMAQSRVKHKMFTDRLADFNAFDTDLNPAYGANWLAKIEFCEAITTDETTVNEMEVIKSEQKVKVLDLIAKVNEVAFYALKAFKDDTEILYEFQFNKVNRPDQYSLNFLVNIKLIHSLAEEEYIAELTTAGMPATLLPQLDDLLSDAMNLEIAHEKYKRIRLRRTRLRIKDMNELYDLYNTVRNAAQIVYANKPEDARMFEIRLG